MKQLNFLNEKLGDLFKNMSHQLDIRRIVSSKTKLVQNYYLTLSNTRKCVLKQ